ncbi:tautomerase family protein [Variovorax sp. Varisp62]|uniref:tautomerase family protein n=1 Tax=Variovorax sp. Varisp62 TaxID=3243049 RepID=UPI0039B448B8
MPFATVRIVAGRDAEKRKAMALDVAQAIARALEAPIESVRVIVQEIPADQWFVGTENIEERRARRARETGERK